MFERRLRAKMEPWRSKVLELIQLIPKGKVTTYGTIAKKLRMPSPRLVGRILHTNTNPDLYPCHRVVFVDGSLAPAYVFGGQEKQKQRLQEENVQFIHEKVDLPRCLYAFVDN